MDKLAAFETFVEAVQAGSLSAAARKRHMSQPAASQQIAALEACFGTRLLHRDRNGVRMTEAGALVHESARLIIDEHKSLEGKLEALSGVVAGQLSITASLGLSQYVLADVIVQMARQYPELKINLHAHDRILDLEKENIDLALRFGRLGDSGGYARKIAELEVVSVASPRYLDQLGRPAKPADLSRYDYIQYRGNDEQFDMLLERNRQKIQVPIKVGLTAQIPDLIFQALESHLGFATLPRFLVEKRLENGELEIILPQWHRPATELFLAYPANRRQSERALAFLAVLFEQLKKTTGSRVAASAREMLAR